MSEGARAPSRQAGVPTAASQQGGVPLALRLVPHALVASVGYVLFAVAALPDLLTARLGIGLSAFGLLTSAPLGAFVLAQPLSSWLADRYPTTLVLLWASAVHVALAVALEVPDGFAPLLALRFCWGLVAGLVLSVGATHVARLLDGDTGTLEQGVYGGMVTLGGAGAFLLAGPVVATTGGPGLHAVGVAPALVAFAGCLRYRRDRRTAPRATSAGSATAAPPTVADTLATARNPTVLLAGAAYVAILGSYITLSTFVTSFFRELGVLGRVNALVLVGATVGRISGGAAVWRFRVGDVGLIGWSALVATAGFLALAVGPGTAWLVALPFAVMLALSVPFGAVYSVAADATDAEGTAIATVVAAGNAAALVLPPLAGALRAATGDYRATFALLAALNAVALASALVLAQGRPASGRPDDA